MKSFNTTRNLFITTVVLLLSTFNTNAGTLYWRTDGTAGGTWTSTFWSNPATATGGTAWTDNSDVIFSANSSLTFVTNKIVKSVTVTNNATVTLTAAGTYSTSGTNSIFDVQGTGLLTMGGQSISTAAGTGITKNGTGTLDLGAQGNLFPVGLTLSAGTVIVSGNNAFGNVLNINGGTIQSSGTRTFAQNITMGGDVTITGTGTPTFTGTVALGNAVRTITNNYNSNNNAITFSGVISNTSGGITYAATAGAVTAGSTIAITNTANNYTGTTSVMGGEVSFAADGSFGAVPGSVTANSIIIDGGRVTTTAIYTLNTNRGIQVGQTAATAISVKSATTLTYNGIIADKTSATGAWSKQGGGIFQLGGVNTYTGATSINNGTIQITIGNDRLPTGTTVSLGQASSANLGTLDLNGFNQTIAGLNSTTGTNATASDNTVINNSATADAVLTLSGSGTYSYGDGTNTNSGIIKDGTTRKVSLIKSGSGTQTLADVNTYTGTTAVNGGTLLVNNASGLSASSAVSVGVSGTLGGGGTAAGTLSLSGTLSPSSTTGASVGNFTTGAQTWNSGAKYKMDVTNVAGTAGTNWDLTTSTGDVALVASGTYTVYLTGNPTGWNGNTGNYTWTFATGGASSTSVPNFGTATFAVDLSGFTATVPSGGSFSVINSGKLLQVKYTPPVPTLAPSPSSLTGFASVSGSVCTSQYFDLSGSNLNTPTVIHIDAPTDFEVSFDNTTFSSSLTITNNTALYSGGPTTYVAPALSATRVYVRIVTTPSGTGAISGSIDIYGGDASITSASITPDPDVTVSGNVTASEPGTHAHDITFANVNSNSFDINWTDGDGASRIVVIRDNTVTNVAPVDGNSYTTSITTNITTTGATTGTGNFVVYNGNAAHTSAITISGLSSSITYSVQVYEYNGSAGSENYLTTGFPVTYNPNTQLTPAPQNYWDVTAGAGNGVGGTGTWGTTFSTVSNGSATLSTCPTTQAAVFQGTAGTVTLGASQTALSNTFNVTGYTLTTSGTSTRVLAGAITLANNVTLSVSPIAAAAITIPSVTGGTSTALNVGGANAANGDATRINLTGGTIASNSSISITTTGTLGISGFVSSSGTSTINATILNNSGVTTMIGATSGNVLNVGDVISGTAGVRFAAGSNGGAGTINLSQVNTYTGGTSFLLSAPNGTVKLGIDNALPATALSFGDGATVNIGGKLDLNGHDQTTGNLSFAIASGAGSGDAVITNNAAGTATNTLTVNEAGNTTFEGQINDGLTRKIALVKTGTGTLKLKSSNTFTGGLTVTQGTFQLANGNIVDNTEAVNLNGGTISTGSSGGFNETMGVLTLSANSKISFGTGNHTLAFANSSVPTWTGTLIIDNWTGTAGSSGTAGKIVFGTDNTGLNATQLSQISFTGYNAGATILSNGEIVPASANLVVDQSGIAAFPNTNVGSASVEQHFTVSGSSLDPTVVITPIAGYEITTTSGSGYVTAPSTITLNTTGGVLNATDIFVRFVPSAPGLVSGNIHVTSGAVTQNVGVSGTGVLSGVYSVGNGDAQTAAIWSFATNGTGQTITTLGGFTSSLDVTIQTGNTVTIENTTAGPSVKNLTVQTGATLKRGAGSASTSLTPYPHQTTDMKYISVYGDIICNGTIGDGIQFDAIGFNIEGTTCNITGSGTNNFNAGRIRKSANTALTTALNINKDVDVWFPGTAIYSNIAATTFNINVATGVNLDFHNGADLAMDGTDGTGSGNRGGTITVNGSITNVDVLYALSNNTSGTIGLTINSGATMGTNIVTYNGASGTGAANFNLNVSSGGTLNIYTGLELRGGTLTAPAGSNIVLKSTAANNFAYVDNFTTGYTGTYSGNITAERFIGGPTGSNQHFIGSPVTGATLASFGANSSGGQLIPTSDCDETQADPSTPASRVFEWHENVPGGAVTCPQKGWFGKISTDAALPAKGYSAYLTSGSVISVTGTPNISAPSNYQVTGLTNSAWTLNTKQSALTSFHYSSGWHLVSNPYPNNVTLNLANHTGFDDVQIYNPSGPFAGTFSSYTTYSGNVAPFQAFYVHVSGGSQTWSIPTPERNTVTGTAFHSQSSQSALTVTVSGNGFNDLTNVEFNSDATSQFDAGYDSRKLRSALGQPTVYTTLNGEHISYNVNRSIEETPVVPLGILPGATGNFTFTFDGINTFDPTSYIYLEDLVTGAWIDVRQNPSYTFSMNATDNEQRFVLHFTPAAQIATVDASCSSNGNINIVQPGNSNWTYTLVDASNNTIVNGTLDVNSPVNVNAPYGVYTLTLVGTNGYTVMKNITVDGAQPVAAAAFSASTSSVQQNDDITFVATTTNVTNYDWDFGDGTTATGVNQLHSYQNTGVYTVTLTVTNQYGCQSTTTQTVTVTQQTTTGITNITGNGKINIWSTGNKLFVDFSKQKNVSATIEVYNVLGQQVCSEKFSTGTVYTKSILNIETAYVIVRVKNENETITKKVLITNQ